MFDEIVGLCVLDDGGDTEDFGGGEGGGAEGVVDGAATIRAESECYFFPCFSQKPYFPQLKNLVKNFVFNY